MGMLDNIRNFFRGTESAPVAQRNDSYEKLEEEIVRLIRNIKRINTLDSSIWNLSNIEDSNDLKRRNLGLEQLQKIQKTLNNRLEELTRQSQRGNATMESLEASKWTGQRTAGMTAHDLDVWQRD